MTKFNETVGQHLRALCDLLYYATSRSENEWAAQLGGVYGDAHNAIKRIVGMAYGAEIAKWTMHYFAGTLGGGRTNFEDLCAAIERAKERVADNTAVSVQSSPEKVRRLARRFARRLRQVVGPVILREIVRRNAEESDSDVCHSHDFCDANEAMVEAAREAALVRRTELRGPAWDLAKANRFWVD